MWTSLALCIITFASIASARNLKEVIFFDDQLKVEPDSIEEVFPFESGPQTNPNNENDIGAAMSNTVVKFSDKPAVTRLALNHGSTVFLQLKYSKRNWVSCFNGGEENCIKATCPGLYLTTPSVSACSGGSFQVYRKNGPGQIHVDDVVAFHYPRQSGSWLSLFNCVGHLNPCPGAPTVLYGMSSDDTWSRCWGEVFKIYAKDKAVGQVITSNDDVFLYYPGGDTYFSFGGANPSCTGCPGTVRPPDAAKYNSCWGENLEIWSI